MSEDNQEMDAWWFRVAYVALFIIFFFVFRYFFNRWRRQALEEQAALHNLQLANQAMDMDSGSRSRNIIIDDSPPPEFEIAVKYSAPVSYIELDCPPPAYEEAVKTITSDNPDLEIPSDTHHQSGSQGIPTNPREDVINHI